MCKYFFFIDGWFWRVFLLGCWTRSFIPSFKISTSSKSLLWLTSPRRPRKKLAVLSRGIGWSKRFLLLVPFESTISHILFLLSSLEGRFEDEELRELLDDLQTKRSFQYWKILGISLVCLWDRDVIPTDELCFEFFSFFWIVWFRFWVEQSTFVFCTSLERRRLKKKMLF